MPRTSEMRTNKYFTNEISMKYHPVAKRWMKRGAATAVKKNSHTRRRQMEVGGGRKSPTGSSPVKFSGIEFQARMFSRHDHTVATAGNVVIGL